MDPNLNNDTSEQTTPFSGNIYHEAKRFVTYICLSVSLVFLRLLNERRKNITQTNASR